jgi:hypothetical protein
VDEMVAGQSSPTFTWTSTPTCRRIDYINSGRLIYAGMAIYA